MHTIIFDNATTDWNEALPTGNGVFGGMVYYRNHRYTTAMNHYEVYYTIHERYAKNYEQRMQKGKISAIHPETSYEVYQQTAKANTRDCEKEAFLHYRKTIWPEADVVRQADLTSGMSHPPTGEFSLVLAESGGEGDFRLQLNIEEAKIKYQKQEMSIQTITLQGTDMILTTISQSEPGMIETLEINYPQRRGHSGYTCQFFMEDSKTFGYQVSFYPQNEDRVRYPPFQFAVLYKLMGAEGVATIKENQMFLRLTQQEQEIKLLTCVVTELQSQNLLEDGKQYLQNAAKKLQSLCVFHKNYWQDFFQKANIEIPDLFLERIWYLNLYVLGCSSGRGGRRKEQACGLNGLWDIRQPTIWGSMWYWDVNIQSAFWPVYTANHLELAEVFNEGLLSYAKMAKRRAEEFYHAKGYAMDYPHEFYNCILPWCAQHLWWYYEYTLDMEFLRKKAYPFFKNVLYFVKEVASFDEESGQYYIFPDVSPEQGPITRNSTITVSTIKYLLEISIRANRILGESQEDAALFLELLEKWPGYSVCDTVRYGRILKDSELAPPEWPLRHPSLLMPVFPVGEMSQYSGEEQKSLARNTVRFASENTELGVFPFGWIASAAARTGQGNTALRILYEQGLDVILRANGMGAEETERWVNHCLVDGGLCNLYYPFMMECVGGILSVVNEMLLQSFDGVIHVFPAVPNGDGESWRERRRQLPLRVREERKAPEKWLDCRFTDLLAKGGFAVSSEMRNGKVVYMGIKSLHGGTVKVDIRGMAERFFIKSDKGAVSYTRQDELLTFDTEGGVKYEIFFEETDVEQGAEQRDHKGISYVSHLGRRVFCGKDPYTDTMKLLDGFLHDYYIANDRCRNVMAWKFSFGVPDAHRGSVQKPIYEPQQKSELDFVKITGDMRYSSCLGFGFGNGEVQARDTREGNILLQDFVFGSGEAVFQIELPKGIYEILVISGGDDREVFTRIKVSAGNYTDIEAKAHRYEAGIVLVVQREDGICSLQVETQAGKHWNLNLMAVRKLTALM